MSAQKIIITGASSGIGEALAREFAKRGCALGLTARRTERLTQLASSLQAQYQVPVYTATLDVTKDGLVGPIVDTLVERLGGLDIIVANAGIVAVNRTGSGDISKDKEVMQTNYIGAVATLDAGARHFRQQQHGQLVGISSVAAWLPIPGSGSYSASKAALTAYLNAARIELHKHGIHVTSVHPGFVNTDFAKNMDKYPFVISAEKAAQEIATGILKKETSVIVPRWPWRVLMPVIGRLPDRLVARFF